MPGSVEERADLLRVVLAIASPGQGQRPRPPDAPRSRSTSRLEGSRTGRSSGPPPLRAAGPSGSRRSRCSPRPSTHTPGRSRRRRASRRGRGSGTSRARGASTSNAGRGCRSARVRRPCDGPASTRPSARARPASLAPRRWPGRWAIPFANGLASRGIVVVAGSAGVDRTTSGRLGANSGCSRRRDLRESGLRDRDRERFLEPARRLDQARGLGEARPAFFLRSPSGRGS